mmetsp:Transcript_84467/g.149475  ORF Transcript_84467/g.149475 Transcript_84467/m.149475 type:complete len:92 (-) Transcript_84467:3340-3615(-)
MLEFATAVSECSFLYKCSHQTPESALDLEVEGCVGNPTPRLKICTSSLHSTSNNCLLNYIQSCSQTLLCFPRSKFILDSCPLQIYLKLLPL